MGVNDRHGLQTLFSQKSLLNSNINYDTLGANQNVASSLSFLYQEVYLYEIKGQRE